MKKPFFHLVILSIMTLTFFACESDSDKPVKKEIKKEVHGCQAPEGEFEYLVEQFADLKILRYQVPGFEDLTLKEKELVYYLSQAALCGRDINFDQNYKHNLCIRRTLEAIMQGYQGDRETEEFGKFYLYLKRVWFSNGIHHHYSSDKFLPEFSKEYFAELIKNSKDVEFPLADGETIDDLIAKLTPIMFDPKIDAKRVCQDAGKDIIKNSACNFYEGVTQKEVEKYYAAVKGKSDPKLSIGLNSKLVKENGIVVEKTYKLGGMYSKAIEKIIYWLEKAITVAENDHQKKALQKLVEFYKTGDLKAFNEFNVLWVTDLESKVDYVCCFTEVYGDPMGMKATWEALINFRNEEATKRTKIISANAQYFEDNSPIDDKYKKKEVKGVSAKVITAAQLGGDCYPATPIGINLPNANWIRAEHGSKSVTIDNITYSYDQVGAKSGTLEEFVLDEKTRENARKFGPLAGNLHTDLHECLGHGSGQLMPGVTGESLKNYHSAVEESRADLFALYFLYDQKMVDLKLIESLDVARAEYDAYLRGGLLLQLKRVEPGKNIEQAHMRCRAIISNWVLEKGQKDSIINKVVTDGKTYIVINDYDKLRGLFGDLLKEVQRITSEGDYKAAQKLVEGYGVKVDPTLHKEVIERYDKLNIAPYSGFLNPVYTPVYEGKKIVDIKVEYPFCFKEQNLGYSRDYSFLPTYN